MDITEIVSPSDVLPNLEAGDKINALREIAAHAAAVHPEIDGTALVKLFLERERLGSTGLGQGVAIPHCKYPGLKKLIGVFARSVQGVPFEAVDGRPVRLFFALIVPGDGQGDYLKALARVSTVCGDDRFRNAVLDAPEGADGRELWDVLKQYDREEP